ncbi:MAG: polyphenol oxidase family protein [Phycisphaerae bacterium]
MLERVENVLTPEQGGAVLVYYRSPLLAAAGVPHAFSTRLGGISTGPFAALNLGNPTDQPVQDEPAHLDANYARLLSAIGLDDSLRAWVQQIHSSRVEEVEPMNGQDPALPMERSELAALVAEHFRGQRQADALVTQLPSVVLTVRVADCVPLLLASADGRAVAAVHAGWRGVVNNIASRALRAFGEMGIRSTEVIAAIGPCISLRHFEVGLEVASFLIWRICQRRWIVRAHRVGASRMSIWSRRCGCS